MRALVTTRFELHDLVTDPIAEEFDIIRSRHTMQHLKTADVVRVVKNFKSSGSRFLLMTNFPAVKVAEEVEINP